MNKPDRPSNIEPLSNEHEPHLTNIISGGLMRTVTPPHIEQDFFKMGYIRHATGGIVATNAGHYALMDWKKNNG